MLRRPWTSACHETDNWNTSEIIAQGFVYYVNNVGHSASHGWISAAVLVDSSMIACVCMPRSEYEEAK